MLYLALRYRQGDALTVRSRAVRTRHLHRSFATGAGAVIEYPGCMRGKSDALAEEVWLGRITASAIPAHHND